MGAQAMPATTAALAAEHHELARYLHARLGHRVTFEEARDAASEALLEAHRVTDTGAVIADRRRWLRRTAWRKAIDIARRQEGQGAQRRPRSVSLAMVGEESRWADAQEAFGDELADQAGRHADARALWAAWAQLAEDEQRAMALRYFDARPVHEVLDALGCTRSQYDNLVKRALRTLRRELVALSVEAGCRACRLLILQDPNQLSGVLAAQRDAHLAGCLACRAYARHHYGLLSALPVALLTHMLGLAG